MKRLVQISLLLLWTWAGQVQAQQDWTWSFGDSIIMHFPNGGAPVVDSLARSRYTLENTACISDSTGDLLYYYDEDSICRADGSKPPGGIHISATSITNGSIIVPIWGGSGYLAFFVSFNCMITNCPFLSQIDRDGIYDSVVVNRSLGYYDGFSFHAEKLAAVRDAQGTGWWVLMHGTEDNKFIKFRVEGDQVSPMVIQSFGSKHLTVAPNPYSTMGEMTFSPQGDKILAVTVTGVVDVFNFDRCTGELSNWDSLGTPAPNVPGPDTYYGCSFSADGTKIYASEATRAPLGSRLFQWDLTAPDIRASKTLIFTAPPLTEMGQHQLGPDGKIYIANVAFPADSLNQNETYLSVIHDPNQAGLACNFVYNGLWLKGKRSTLSLPNLPNYNLPPLVRQVAEAGPRPGRICPGDSVEIGFPDSTQGAVVYHWSPSYGLSDSSAARTWAHPDSSTMYYLRALDTAMGLPCGQTIDSVWVEVLPPAALPLASLGADTTLCAGDSLRLLAAPGWEYAWSTGDTTAEIWVGGAGTYAVTVQNPAGNLHCMTARDTIVIQQFVEPAALAADFAGQDQVICRGDTVAIGLATAAGWTYQWSPSPDLSAVNVAQPLAWPVGTATFEVTARDSSSAGRCFVQGDSLEIRVEYPLVQAAPADVEFCLGECFLLGTAAEPGLVYAWSPTDGLRNPNQSMTQAQPAATTLYTLLVTDPALESDGCRSRSFQVLATAEGCPAPSFIAFNGDGIAEVLDFGPHVGEIALEVYDMSGKLVFSRADYVNDWSAGELAHGLYVYRVAIGGDCPSRFVGKLVVFLGSRG